MEKEILKAAYKERVQIEGNDQPWFRESYHPSITLFSVMELAEIEALFCSRPPSRFCSFHVQALSSAAGDAGANRSRGRSYRASSAARLRLDCVKPFFVLFVLCSKP